MSDMNAYAVIQGVRVPVMVVDGPNGVVELPTAALEGYGTIKVYDCIQEGNTYKFKVDDFSTGLMGQAVTFSFNPKATEY